MKRFLLFLLLLITVLAVAYFLGPKPEKPTFAENSFTFPDSLSLLEQEIHRSEMAVKGIKPDNEARIVWADSSKKEKTPYAFLYIHGFSASQEEGDPVHTNLAKKFGANLYLARLDEHGIDLGDETMANLTADKLATSAEKALAIAKKLGNEVVVIGTSMGGALTLYLASKHPEIKTIALYSPCIKIFDPTAELLDDPWGLQIAKQVKKSDFNDPPSKNDIQPKYWATHYRLEAIVALQNFLSHTMKPETFAKVKCPTFLAYYYKDDVHQDSVVSVPAMLKMYDELGTSQKEKVAFPNAGDHVIASYVTSGDWQGVQHETEKYLEKILSKK